MGVLTHVDDIETICVEERGKNLMEHCAAAGLNVAWEGPLNLNGGKCKFLKRNMESVEGGIFVEQDRKHIQKLVELTDVSKMMGKSTPCPANPHKCGDERLLNGSQYAKYRTAIGILLYIGPERPDILYAVKVLSSRTATPRQHEWKLLCHLVRYLKEREKQGLLFTESWPGRTLEQRCLELKMEVDKKNSKPFAGPHLLESVSDASWCSEPGRLSVSCAVIYLNGNPIYLTNKRQKSVVLSSCEAELHGSLLSLQEAIMIKGVVETLTGDECKLVHRVDNSACRALLNREGLGGLKHVDLAYLWCQEKRKSGVYTVNPIGTRFCPPDIGTKPHSAPRCRMLSFMCGVASSGGHGVVAVGRFEFWEAWKDEAMKKTLIKSQGANLKQNLRSVLALSMLEIASSSRLPQLQRVDFVSVMVEQCVQLFGILALVILVSWFFLDKAWISGKVGNATVFFVFYLNMVWIAAGQKDDDFEYLNQASTSTRSSPSSTGVETLVSWSSSTWSSTLCWVILFVILAFVALMQPRRWNRRHSQEELESGINERGGDQHGEPLPRGEVRDRLHDWMEYVVIPQIFGPSRSSTDPNGTGGTGHSQSSSSSASGTTHSVAYTGESLRLSTAAGSRPDANQGGDAQRGSNQPERQAPETPKPVVLIGPSKAGKAYHRATCGMVKKWRSEKPGALTTTTEAYALTRGMKPCKQCGP